jgi:hypothetical protein
MRRVVWLAFLGAACRVQPPQASAIDAERTHVELAQLQEGRELLIHKCSGACHQVPMPSQHAPLEWPRKLDEMSMRAGLDVRQRALIEQYLVTMSLAARGSPHADEPAPARR